MATDGLDSFLTGEGNQTKTDINIALDASLKAGTSAINTKVDTSSTALITTQIALLVMEQKLCKK